MERGRWMVAGGGWQVAVGGRASAGDHAIDTYDSSLASRSPRVRRSGAAPRLLLRGSWFALGFRIQGLWFRA